MITRPKTKIGPEHQGRKMPLKSFEFADVVDGHVYELARGYVVVSEVPDYVHACLVTAVRDPLIVYKSANPGRIHQILGTMECKLLLPALQTERHPDLAIYLTPPARRQGRTVWRTWIPEVVIEVVSVGSVERDYVEKREEYWQLGVKEYWIVDAAQKRVLVLKRGRTDWTQRELHESDVCETKLLPGFKLPCRTIFAAVSESDQGD